MKLASFDVGTNTVLMLAIETGGDSKPHPLLELSRITRLGRGVDHNSRLDPHSASLTLETIVEFARRARKLGCQRIVAAATAALRDAKDGRDFIARVKERAGIDLEIIPGSEEASLSHLAVVRGLQIDPADPLLIVDIGGGSTELIRSEAGHELQMTSLQIGSVRLTERCLSSDPPSSEDSSKLTQAIDEAVEKLGWDFHPARLVGIAGTVTTICAVALGLEPYDSKLVHGHVLTRAEVDGATEKFRTLPLDQRRKLPGLPEGRADVIYAGATILERIMTRFSVSEVTVSDQGVRWGLVWRELDRAGSRS